MGRPRHIYGSLTVTQVRHTGISLRVDSVNPTGVSYKVQNADETIVSSFLISGTGSHTLDLNGVPPDRTTQRLTLLANEGGYWVIQKQTEALLDDTPVIMAKVSASSSIAATSAMVRWEQPYDGAVYEVRVFDYAPTGLDSVPTQLKPNDLVSNSNGERGVIVSDLQMDSEHWVVVIATELNASGVEEKIMVQPLNFTTSAGAVFIV